MTSDAKQTTAPQQPRVAFSQIPKKPIRFLLVRHGQSEANAAREKYFQEGGPGVAQYNFHELQIPDEYVQLTERGFEQATAVGKYLREYLDKTPYGNGGITLFCSSYMRARQTAQRIYDQVEDVTSYPHVRVHESDFIVEQSHGYFDGLSEDARDELFPHHKVREDMHYKNGSRQFAPMLGGEMQLSVSLRARVFLTSAFNEMTEHNSDTIIIVNHGRTMRQIAKVLLKMMHEEADVEPNPDNCDVRLIQREPNLPGFADYGAIWHRGQQVAPQLVPHRRIADEFEKGAFRNRRPSPTVEILAASGTK